MRRAPRAGEQAHLGSSRTDMSWRRTQAVRGKPSPGHAPARVLRGRCLGWAQDSPGACVVMQEAVGIPLVRDGHSRGLAHARAHADVGRVEFLRARSEIADRTTNRTTSLCYLRSLSLLLFPTLPVSPSPRLPFSRCMTSACVALASSRSTGTRVRRPPIAPSTAWIPWWTW